MKLIPLVSLFPKAIIYSFWPREHEVVLAKCHQVASFPTSSLWSNPWKLITLLCSNTISHLSALQSLLLLAKQDVIPCMHVMYQVFQFKEICLWLSLLHTHSFPSHKTGPFPTAPQHLQNDRTLLFFPSQTQLCISKALPHFLDQFSLQWVCAKGKI